MHPFINTLRTASCVAILACLMAVGCDDSADRAGKPDPEPKAAEGKKVRVGDNVYLEIIGKKRRVLVTAEVCLRKGPLEQLLTRKKKKEHEAILSADLDARKIHEALLLANAKEGEPVRYTPKYRPASGTAIKITLVYKDEKGVKKTVNARSWLKNAKTGKELDCDWVFAGSMLIANSLDKDAPKYYLANDGDIICVSNFDSALLDVPIKSSKDDADRGYEAWEDRIPPVGTEVTVILEPVIAEKPKKK
jgi:hypothetical protein